MPLPAPALAPRVTGVGGLGSQALRSGSPLESRLRVPEVLGVGCSLLFGASNEIH